MEDEHETSALRHRRKKPSLSLSGCFTGHGFESFESSSPAAAPSPSQTLKRSPSTWFRSRAHEPPEIRGRCRNFISRMGKHHRHRSADLSYDPLSYALNFEDDDAAAAEVDVRNFRARLPSSPPATRRLAALDLRTNVPVPRDKKETPGLRLSPPPPPMPKGSAAAAEGRRNFELPPPAVESRPSREIVVETC